MIPKMSLTLFVNNDTQHKKCITSRITIFGFLLYFFEKFRIQCTIFLSEQVAFNQGRKYQDTSPIYCISEKVNMIYR